MRVADTQKSMTVDAMRWESTRGSCRTAERPRRPQGGLAVDTPLQKIKWLPGGTGRGATHGVSREARRRNAHRTSGDNTLSSRQMLDS